MEKIDQLIASVEKLVNAMREADGRALDVRRCYTTEEAAAVLRVSVTTVHRMVKAGMRYRSVLEKGYIFLGSDILNFLDAHEEKHTELRRSDSKQTTAHSSRPNSWALDSGHDMIGEKS